MYIKPIPLNLKQMFDSVSFVVDSKEECREVRVRGHSSFWGT